MDLKITKMSIEDITPYENNAKEHPQEQIDQIAESIEQFGMNDPIAVWGKKNTIVEGHGRYEACRQMGITEVPVIRLDHLTEEQRKAYTLVHNKLTLNSDFDLELLEDELASIAEIDMAAFGFELPDDEDPEPVDDEYAGVLPAQPKSKRGQLYRLGPHRLLVGDATDPADMERLMQGDEADMILTDPPYNVDYGSKNEYLNAADKGNRVQDPIEGDAMDAGAFEEFLTSAFETMADHTRDGGSIYVWYASSRHIQFEQAMTAAGMRPRQQLIWAKKPFVIGRQDYQWQHEPCLYGWKDTGPHYFTDRRDLASVFDDQDLDKMTKAEAVELLRMIQATTAIGTVIREKKPAVSDLHPTMKPVTILGRLIVNSSMAGDIVLDPFGGSGSTLIAGEQMGRNCRMMELDPRYADVIIDRWETFTGERAELLEE